MSHLECNNQNCHTPSARYSYSNRGESGYVLSEKGFLPQSWHLAALVRIEYCHQHSHHSVHGISGIDLWANQRFIDTDCGIF